jgi:hypothetical protein
MPPLADGRASGQRGPPGATQLAFVRGAAGRLDQTTTRATRSIRRYSRISKRREASGWVRRSRGAARRHAAACVGPGAARVEASVLHRGGEISPEWPSLAV